MSGPRGWAVANHPFFWLAWSGLFAVNGLLSAGQGRWPLAVLQTGTGILALFAAASAGGTSDGPGSTEDRDPPGAAR